MTVISIEQFRQALDHYLCEDAERLVVLTVDGRPRFLLHNLMASEDQAADSNDDCLDVQAMIRQRRQEKGIPWEEAKKQLDLD